MWPYVGEQPGYGQEVAPGIYVMPTQEIPGTGLGISPAGPGEHPAPLAGTPGWVNPLDALSQRAIRPLKTDEIVTRIAVGTFLGVVLLGVGKFVFRIW